jgi:hypothetical protein
LWKDKGFGGEYLMPIDLSLTVYRIKREEGVKAAKAYAYDHGYLISWDIYGTLTICDLLAD